MSTPVRRRRLLVHACLGAALAAAACDGKNNNDPPTVTPGSTNAPRAEPLAPVKEFSELLPRDSSLLITGSSLTRAFEVFERDRLVEKFRPQYESIRAGISGVIGHDLLDPAAYPAMGIDPDGPVGIAVPDVVAGQIVVLATVADASKLKAMARDAAGRAKLEMVEQDHGGAVVLRVKGEEGSGLVIRDKLAAMVFDLGRREGAVDLPRRLATMDPHVSLASDVGFRKSIGALRSADLNVYTDLAGIVERVNVEAEARAAEPQNNWAQQQLVQAQKEGASAERLAELEQQAEQERKWQAEYRARQQAERAMLELLFSGIDSVGLTAAVKRTGPVYDGRIVAGEDAFLRRLLVNREGAPLLPRSMKGAPLLCLSGGIDGPALGELVDAMAAMDGTAPGEYRAEVKSSLGVDLQADLWPAMKGDAEMCLTMKGDLVAAVADAKEAIEVGIAVELDPAKAKYLLAKLANSKEGAKRLRKRGGGYTYEGGLPFGPMVLDVVGERVVMSTDPELAQRIAKGDPGSTLSLTEPAAARGAIELPGTAASYAFDMSQLMLWMAVGVSDFGAPAVIAPGFTEEEMAEVPLSRASKKANKALDKANKEIERLQRKMMAEQVKGVAAITDPFGLGVVAVLEDERGFSVAGGQFLRADGMGQLVERTAQAVLDMSQGGGTRDPELDKAMQEAFERRVKAQEAFAEARLADAERALKKNRKR